MRMQNPRRPVTMTESTARIFFVKSFKVKPKFSSIGAHSILTPHKIDTVISHVLVLCKCHELVSRSLGCHEQCTYHAIE